MAQRDLIQQIESLQLPKRVDKRRSVYLGENLRCWLKVGAFEARVDVIDISTSGIAVVEARRLPELPLKAGHKVFLEFSRASNKAYKVKGIVSNISDISFGGRSFKRLGIRFDMLTFQTAAEFIASLPVKPIPCHSFVRPQASCHDPFFFKEVVLFQVNGFTPTGMDLQVSARCKTLLPSQPLLLDVFVPGRGNFKVPVVNSEMIFPMKSNRYRFFVKYDEAPRLFLEAVSEYLCMLAVPAVTPKQLRADGFVVGNLNLAVDVSYAPTGHDVLVKHDLIPSVIAQPPLAKGNRQNHKLPAFARHLNCKVGPHLAATAGLIFVDGKPERSQVLHAQRHKLDEQILKAGHLELVDFHISRQVALVDFLIPLLKQVFRIAAQGKAKYLVLESGVELLAVLQKIGFEKLDSKIIRPNPEGKNIPYTLLALEVRKVLGNHGDFLPKNLWERVFKDLHLFLQASV